jgi:hypothetical protein
MTIKQEIKELKEKLETLEKKVNKDDKFETCNGLTWSNSIGKELTWDEAKKFAKDCRDGGFKDWRLPTISELQNVFDYEKGENKIEGWDFENAGYYYWSSTTVSTNTYNVWTTYQNNGYTFNTTKTTTYAVRCVLTLRPLE